MRAKQFESGRVDDKTDFYKSELSRLSSKHNVPNVAVRKMEYEQKLYSDKKQLTTALQRQDSKDESYTSCSSKYIVYRYMYAVCAETPTVLSEALLKNLDPIA